MDLKKWGGRLCTGFICLRIGINCGVFVRKVMNHHKQEEISQTDEQLCPSQERLGFVQLISSWCPNSY